jgi:hypothetical protein
LKFDTSIIKQANKSRRGCENNRANFVREDPFLDKSLVAKEENCKATGACAECAVAIAYFADEA